MKVLINCILKIDPEFRDTLIAGAIPLIEMAREEPGCLAYNWSIDLALDDTIHVFEEWQDQESLAAHFVAPSYYKMSEHLSKGGLLGAKASKFLVEKEAGIHDQDGKANAYFT